MKLKYIAEDINRKEFFDFYALLYAYQEKNHPRREIIKRYLEYLSDIIYNDHINQFADILIDRIANSEDDNVMSMLNEFGIDMDESYVYHGLDNIDITQKMKLIRKLVDSFEPFGFTGKTWLGLANEFLKLENAPVSLNSKILIIDKIYNLVHHGGEISDYMDERAWMGNALNIRDVASPAQILQLSSSKVRELVGRTEHTNVGKVKLIDRIHTALRRAAKGNHSIKISKINNATIKVETTYMRIASFPFIMYGTEIDTSTDIGKYFKKFEDKIKIFNRELLIKFDKNNATVIGPQNSLEIRGPIRKEYKFARDIISASTTDSKLSRGPGANQFKNYQKI